jgi:hypothetical protein
VHGQQDAAAEILIRADRGPRIHVNVEPARRRAVGADLDQVELRVAVTRVNGAEVIGIARVAAEVEGVLRAFDDP